MARPDLIGIVVKDMASSLQFYRALGLEFSLGAESEAHVEVILAGGFRMAWDTLELIKGMHADWPEPVGHRMGLAFACDTPAEVDELYDRMVTAGHSGFKKPWDAFWGQRYATLLDPDGNLVDLFAWVTQ